MNERVRPGRRALVVPVPSPVDALVDAIRHRFDPVMAARIDAHVTLVHDVVDAARADELLAPVASAIAPFEITLTRATLWGPARYGTFLDVDDPTGGLTRLHDALADLEAPAWARVGYRPHVTLVHGRTVTEAHADAAWAELADLAPSWRMEVVAVDVLELGADRWTCVSRAALTGA